MKCVVCKLGETKPGKATLILQRHGATVVINGVPARVSENCGEDYVDEKVAESVLAAAEASARAGAGSRSATTSRLSAPACARLAPAAGVRACGSTVSRS